MDWVEGVFDWLRVRLDWCAKQMLRETGLYQRDKTFKMVLE